MFLINLQDSRPIYEQVVESFRMLILKGIIARDEKLPSVRNMAVELSINPNTIQKAYAELERQGYIYTVKGKGNFAAGGPELLDFYRGELWNKLEDLFQEALSIGIADQELQENALRILKESAERGEKNDRDQRDQ